MAMAAKFDGVVYLTSRDETRGRKAIEDLNKLGLYPEYHQLDIDDESSVLKLRDFLVSKHGGLDVLVYCTFLISYLCNSFNDHVS